ncbi:hypothetical protein ACLB0R_02350 [Sphingomonas sp. GlSt437]|jgi:hypothetical protein|uniref:hypothetical protein n=1 Tax=Sphingomonas sp. GlSt437 TaxID=3389970 RepID=UPI003A838E0E
MKIQAILEFDLEDEDGHPIADRREYIWAAEATDDAIRSRLMGAGFLDADTLIGTYTLDVRVIDGKIGNPEPEPPEPS